MESLNLPRYPLKVRKKGETSFEVFDVIRKKWFQLTPEEWVRQHWIHHLATMYHVPFSLISCETGHKHGSRAKRTDLLAWKEGKVELLLECKAPKIVLNQKALDQAILYQKEHQAQFIMLSNGMDHFCFRCNVNSGQLESITSLPTFEHW